MVQTPVAQAVEAALATGDLGKLTTEARINYYNSVCKSVGVNPLTRPFEYITLNGKLTLYCRRDATDQLRRLNNVSVRITSAEKLDDVYVVTALANMGGREDTSTGVVSIGGLKGEMLANALMKAETKAKRRVTLSIVGLGWLDETEVETVPNAVPFTENGGNGHEPGVNRVAVTVDGEQYQIDRPTLPLGDALTPTEERPKRPPYKDSVEFCELVAKWLPRYRDASDPTKVNTFSMMASLKRIGVETLSDPRAWPHLCMRNDAEGGKSA